MPLSPLSVVASAPAGNESCGDAAPTDSCVETGFESEKFYRAVTDETGLWVIERMTRGMVLGQIAGGFRTEPEALLAAFKLTRTELEGWRVAASLRPRV
jgi:hypothetical protein